MTIPLLFSAKMPSDNLDFSLDFVKFLMPHELITSATVTASPSGLSIASPTITKSVVTAFIAGGTLNTSYVVSYSITTDGGRHETRSGILNVLAL